MVPSLVERVEGEGCRDEFRGGTHRGAWSPPHSVSFPADPSNTPRLLFQAPSRSLYCASKFAVNGFFDSVRIELAQYGISIGLVCPMTVDTQLRNQAVDKVEGISVQPKRKGEKKMSPEEVAAAVGLALLASVLHSRLTRRTNADCAMLRYPFPNRLFAGLELLFTAGATCCAGSGGSDCGAQVRVQVSWIS